MALPQPLPPQALVLMHKISETIRHHKEKREGSFGRRKGSDAQVVPVPEAFVSADKPVGSATPVDRKKGGYQGKHDPRADWHQLDAMNEERFMESSNETSKLEALFRSQQQVDPQTRHCICSSPAYRHPSSVRKGHPPPQSMW